MKAALYDQFGPAREVLRVPGVDRPGRPRGLVTPG